LLITPLKNSPKTLKPLSPKTVKALFLKPNRFTSLNTIFEELSRTGELHLALIMMVSSIHLTLKAGAVIDTIKNELVDVSSTGEAIVQYFPVVTVYKNGGLVLQSKIIIQVKCFLN
jgi:hypothetical protein